MFRRLFLTLLILAIIIAGSGSIVLAEENEIEIAFIRATGEPYYQYGSQAAEAAAKKLGVKMVVYTSNLDSAQELANVQDAIARGCDGILIYAVSLSSERAAVDTASKAKVPIFFQSGYHTDLLPLSAGFMDNSLKEFSKPLGIWMAENLEKGKVAVIEGALGRGDSEAYTEGFKEGLSQNPNLENEIIDVITQGKSKDNRSLGKEVLNKYNYDKNISLRNEPIINESIKTLFSLNALFIAIIFILIVILVIYYFKNIYSDINDMTSYVYNSSEGRDFEMKNMRVYRCNIATIAIQEHKGILHYLSTFHVPI